KEEDERLAQAIQAESDGLISEEVDSILETPTFCAPRILPSETPKVSGIASKTTWKFRIVNKKLIPREYLIPDEKAIGGIARSLGERANIPGVEFYPEMNISAGRR
ncbi:MAG: hypothetical protein JNK65_09385, partial [Deltaproteobacteria bacterium]|nr:hypothetical protein [Deltaproteobacteria bacterium]